MAMNQPEEIKWTELTQADGLSVAELLVNQLREAGIPAYAWQQAAGTALGITVGPLGEVHVMVPEERLAEAEDFLNAVPLDDPDPEDEDFDEDFDDFDDFDNDVYTDDEYEEFEDFDEDDEYVSRCPHCRTVVDLDEEEVERGWYACPRCGRRVRL